MRPWLLKLAERHEATAKKLKWTIRVTRKSQRIRKHQNKANKLRSLSGVCDDVR